jgi:streptogramin lyase
MNVLHADNRRAGSGRLLLWCALLAAALCGVSACDGGGGSSDVANDDAADAEDGDTPPDVTDVTDDGEAGACVDLDGDGYGRNCAAGPDCDDANPLVFDTCASCTTGFPPPGCACLPSPPYPPTPCYEGPAGTAGVGQCLAGTRACVDGHLVYECVGQTLPSAEELCGDGVDNNCNGLGDEEAAGPCLDCDMTCNTSSVIVPDPLDPGAMGLDANPAGAGVVLGIEDIHAGFVWVPNTDEGSVSKLEIATGTELGRYRVGQTGADSEAPSRTAVDAFGDLYVANQANVSTVMTQGSVTKIAGDAAHCVDRNRNGTIETSSGATRLPLGTDECVLWTVPVGAAAAVPQALAVHLGATGAAGSPWVGTSVERRFYRLDPVNGAEVDSVDVEVSPFGAVAAPGGWIWVAGRSASPPSIQRFNAVSGGLDPMVPTPAECDPWGIAVDSAGRVWIGGTGGYVCRYDPADGSWITVAMPRGNTPGVAVSGTDVVWTASYDGTGVTLSQFPTTDPATITQVALPGDTVYAVAADRFGYVWTVNYASNTVTRFNVATGETGQFSTGRGPAPYSDFTGLERTIIATSGTWSADFTRCDTSEEDRWGEVRWTAATPADSSIALTIQCAVTADDLATAPVVPLVAIPPGSATPVDIESALAAAGAASYAYLRVTATLAAAATGESPVLEGVEVRWHCAAAGG